MRFAVVSPTVRVRREVSADLLDAEWLAAAVGAGDDVAVLVDHATPGSDIARDSGCEVIVSPKREMTLDDELTADGIQARRLMEYASAGDLDFVLYASDSTTDLSWFERRLGDIPRGVAISELAARQPYFLDDATAPWEVTRRLWAGTGFVASADFVLSDVALGEYGYSASPPRLSTRNVEVAPAPSAPVDGLVVVVAVTAGPERLAALGVAVESAVEPAEATTLAVIVSDDAIDVARAYWPEALSRSTVFVAPGDDGVAFSFLSRADVVLASGPADLAIPAVADRGASLLSGDTETAPGLSLDQVPSTPAPSAGTLAVPVGGSPAEVRDLLPSIDAELVVLHQHDFGEDALKVARLRGLGEVDAVVLAASDPVLGSPDLAAMSGGLLGVHRSSWPALGTLLSECPDLPSLVARVVARANAGRMRLAVLPTSQPAVPLPDAAVGTPWLGGRPLIKPAALGTAGTEPSGIRDWVAGHGWRDRLRVALPWRWGALERAMKDRW